MRMSHPHFPTPLSNGRPLPCGHMLLCVMTRKPRIYHLHVDFHTYMYDIAPHKLLEMRVWTESIDFT